MKRKKNIEIYFVLYLAALILLITKKDDIADIDIIVDESVRFGFILQPLKTNLNCRLAKDSSGINIISIDSLNTIFYYGDVSDVSFEFIVEDQSLNQQVSLTAENTNSNPYFRVSENPDKKSASFYWWPRFSENTNKSYLVTVIATASTQSENENIPSQLTQQTQFSLNIIYTDETFGTDPGVQIALGGNDTSRSFFQQPTIINSFVPSGEVRVSIYNKFVKKLAGQTWENEIFVDGVNLNNELLDEPIVFPSRQSKINGGFAGVKEIRDRKIVLSGITPNSGNMKVSINFTLKSNGKEYTEEFTVQPHVVGDPVYERQMYPEISYEIDPNLPFDAGVETRAVIKDGNEVIFRSDQGGKFTYIPYLSDTGKTLSLERYMNGELVGQKYAINILNYPNPEIRAVQYISENQMKVTTHSYGFVNGQPNYVDLEVDGEVYLSEDRGSIPQSRNRITHVQVFQFIRTGSQEVTFRAVDQRGRKSQQRNYKFDK